MCVCVRVRVRVGVYVSVGALVCLGVWVPAADEAGAEMPVFDDDNLAKKSVFSGMCVYQILVATHAQAPHKKSSYALVRRPRT